MLAKGREFRDWRSDKEPRMEDSDDKLIWDALLRQAEANLRQAEANVRQAEANEGTSSSIKLLTQWMLCKEETAALEPDRLDVRGTRQMATPRP